MHMICPSWVPSLATSSLSLGWGVFFYVSVSHYQRLCNQAADTLAVHGTVMYAGSCDVWLGQFPNFIKNCVPGDLSSNVN
jgi:hypothetical protein